MDVTAQKPFPFTALPAKLRFMIYEHVIQPKLRSLFPASDQHGVYFEDVEITTSFLLVCKSMYHEVKTCILRPPVTIIIDPGSRPLTAVCTVLTTLATARKMDIKHQATLKGGHIDDDNFNRFTFKQPVSWLKSTNRDLYYSERWTPANEQTLHDFLSTSLLKLRRGRAVHIRVLCCDKSRTDGRMFCKPSLCINDLKSIIGSQGNEIAVCIAAVQPHTQPALDIPIDDWKNHRRAAGESARLGNAV